MSCKIESVPSSNMSTHDDNAAVISIRNVSKMYRIYADPRDRLKEYMFYAFRHFMKSNGDRFLREFWALRDISFDVAKGESIGIIGRNGAGKSTLLQIVAKTLRPTAGEARVNGRVAALLELGSGFNNEFTGRENVYINASILGLSQKEIDAKFGEIEAFAEIGDFIDQPVKIYSSGMMLRLAFAVQTAIEPDILIVDEALSVGDFFFAQKCAARMRELRDKGTTVLLVSHDMSSVRDLCERAVYLRQGQVVYFGDSKKAISLYYQEAHSADGNTVGQCSTPSRGKPSTNVITNFLERACWIRDSGDPFDPTPAKILGVSVLDTRYEPTMKVRVGDELIIHMLFQTHRDYACSTSLMIKNRFDQVVSCCGTYTCGIDPHFFKSGETGIFEFRIRCMLEAGLYSFQVTLGSEGPLPNRGCDIDSSPWLGPVHMDWDYQNERAPFLGMFGIPVSGKYLDNETSADI